MTFPHFRLVTEHHTQERRMAPPRSSAGVNNVRLHMKSYELVKFTVRELPARVRKIITRLEHATFGNSFTRPWLPLDPLPSVTTEINFVNKGKAVPLQAWTGP
jgi:hypothetical protein